MTSEKSTNNSVALGFDLLSLNLRMDHAFYCFAFILADP